MGVYSASPSINQLDEILQHLNTLWDKMLEAISIAISITLLFKKESRKTVRKNNHMDPVAFKALQHTRKLHALLLQLRDNQAVTSLDSSA